MSDTKNDVIIVRRNPLSEPAEWFALIGRGPYMHGRLNVETIFQEDGETQSQLYNRACARCDQINAGAMCEP